MFHQTPHKRLSKGTGNNLRLYCQGRLRQRMPDRSSGLDKSKTRPKLPDLEKGSWDSRLMQIVRRRPKGDATVVELVPRYLESILPMSGLRSLYRLPSEFSAPTGSVWSRLAANLKRKALEGPERAAMPPNTGQVNFGLTAGAGRVYRLGSREDSI